MALFDQTLIDEINRRVTEHHAALGAALGHPPSTSDVDPIAQSAPLSQNLKLLIGIANGEWIRGEASKDAVVQAEAALSQAQAALFGNAMQTRAAIPDDFWQTDIGVLFSRVRWWISADALISISNAAALAFGENTQANRMRIARAIDSGLLDWVPDPSVANPQQNRCVLRPQVEQLGEQRRRPQ